MAAPRKVKDGRVATPKKVATGVDPTDDPNVRRAKDPKEVIRLGKIIVDPEKSDAEQLAAAKAVLAQYGVS